ncbi:MAG TPA: YraN family protein [Rhodanobacteraceae bacterium]|nr:YraN family protein [Rhodanobacteraceae bacterium]
MRTPRRATGDAYEDRALRHLQGAGLVLVARNFNTRHGELDLVMRDGEALVFVEVRFRQRSGFGNAADSVTPAKQARLVRAAGLFLQAHPRLAHRPCRFDVLAFDAATEGARCNWLRAAFEAQ